MNALATKSLNSVKYGLEANYYVSLLVTVVTAIMSVTGKDSFFTMGDDLYGPLGNNLKIMLIYLALAQLVVFIYCLRKQNYRELTIMGLFIILLIGGVEFYGAINDVPIDEKYNPFFLYTGLSHIFYGILSFLPDKKDQMDATNIN
ncbi:hypothetical protein GO003_003835 [Methylicorpusculum oleiharenae]|uniref:hypothetical protein n=1 Tax=Methylicorpusculum oleiharenae TaxID=1338687 RepID=UPI0013572148|nr:hypothetical protein [Methylicorpusculum oleiharenae]MCD2449514.1 hypothetical protein [Methylicorpusculum oleiharenae]